MIFPLVSIIIPAYNHEDYIEATLISLIKQTYSEIELIIINDGSTDNTLKKINQLQLSLNERFKRVEVISQENKGICKTINTGIKASSNSSYIFICPSDDIFAENFIMEQVLYLENNKQYSCSYTDGLNINSDDLDKQDYSKGAAFSNLFFYESGDLRAFMLKHYLKLPTPSFVYRASIFKEIGLYDESLYFEDVDMFLRISQKHRIGCIHKKLFYRRLHHTNSGRNPDIIINGLKQIVDKYEQDPSYSESERLELTGSIRMDIEILSRKYKKIKYVQTEEFTNLVGEKRLFIWGTGTYAKDIINTIPIDVAMFIESQPNKDIYLNKKVISSYSLQQLHRDYFILVASSFEPEIINWLNNHGYEKGIDYI